MLFGNVIFFRFPTTLDLQLLDAGLEEAQLKPVGPLEMSSRGFVSPYGTDSAVLSMRQGQSIGVTVAGEDRLLPAAVVNDLLQKKIAEVEQREGRRLGGRSRKRLKEDLITELLPRTLIKPSRNNAILDTELGLVAVDTSSRKTGESVVSEIRRALGSFPAIPVNAEVAPRSVLTGWVAGEALPEGLVLGDECELRDPAGNGAVVKCQRHELQSDEIAKHLESGKQVTRLALTLDERVSFVLGEDLVVRKLKLLDGAVTDLERLDAEDLRAELDARFALMGGELKRLFGMMARAFRLSEVAA